MNKNPQLFSWTAPAPTAAALVFAGASGRLRLVSVSTLIGLIELDTRVVGGV